MTKGGLIIRLIDVVLILLLGFISISDLTVKTQVKLPQGANESNTTIQKSQAVFIKIDKDGLFEIDDGINKTPGISDINLIEQRLIDLKKSFHNLVVIIEPDPDSIIQIAVDLIDICEKNNILKSINYEL